MSTTIADVRHLLERRIEEIDAEAAPLRQAVERLTPKRKRRRRPRGQRAAEFLEAIGRHRDFGLTAAEVARTVGITSNHAYVLGQRLVQEGKVRKVGKRYRPVP